MRKNIPINLLFDAFYYLFSIVESSGEFESLKRKIQDKKSDRNDRNVPNFS